MGFIDKTPEGRYRAYFRDPSAKQRSKTFRTKKDANAFLAEVATSKARGSYVAPHAGRALFADHAARWMESWNTEATTTARDRSVMRTHVLPRWGSWQLARIDHLAVQTWVSEVGERRSPHTVARCYMLTSAVLRSAVRNRLIPTNPAEGVRLPRIRRRDTDERIISRHELQTALLPALPARHRALVATAAGTGLRWGEVAGLRRDALDLDGRALVVLRTVIEVSGSTSFKAFPKSSAGRRTVPLCRCRRGWCRSFGSTSRNGRRIPSARCSPTRSVGLCAAPCSVPGSGVRRWSAQACLAGSSRTATGTERSGPTLAERHTRSEQPLRRPP